MRKLIFLFIAVFCTVILSAQTKDTETLDAAKKHTADAAAMLKEDNYPAAMRQLTKAKAEVKKLVDEQIVAALPKKSGIWLIEKQKNSSAGSPLGMAAMGQEGINTVVFYIQESAADTANKSFQAQGADKNAKIIVTVSNTNKLLKQSIETAHKSDVSKVKPAPAQDEVVKAIKVKDYPSLSRVNPKTKTAGISVDIANCTIQIQGIMLDNTDAVMKIAEAIDYGKINAVFQE